MNAASLHVVQLHRQESQLEVWLKLNKLHFTRLNVSYMNPEALWYICTIPADIAKLCEVTSTEHLV